jgi:AraC-like DNA-binding protein
MNRFERIARVFRHLEKHHTQQPDLANCAQVAGMSPYYFHRL